MNAKYTTGQHVTRKGTKVWEIATVSRVADVVDPLYQDIYGGPEAWVYTLKNPGTATKPNRCWWQETALTSV